MTWMLELDPRSVDRAVFFLSFLLYTILMHVGNFFVAKQHRRCRCRCHFASTTFYRWLNRGEVVYFGSDLFLCIICSRHYNACDTQSKVCCCCCCVFGGEAEEERECEAKMGLSSKNWRLWWRVVASKVKLLSLNWWWTTNERPNKRWQTAAKSGGTAKREKKWSSIKFKIS